MGLFKTRNVVNYFQEKGITVEKVPNAILIHELMGIFMLATTWSLCYCFPISQSKYLKKPIENMLSKMPNVFSSAIQGNDFLTSRFGISYMESSCLRKMIRPFTLPAKLFLTVKLVQLTPPINSILKFKPKVQLPHQERMLLDDKSKSAVRTISDGLFEHDLLKKKVAISSQGRKCFSDPNYVAPLYSFTSII